MVMLLHNCWMCKLASVALNLIMCQCRVYSLSSGQQRQAEAERVIS